MCGKLTHFLCAEGYLTWKSEIQDSNASRKHIKKLEYEWESVRKPDTSPAPSPLHIPSSPDDMYIHIRSVSCRSVCPSLNRGCHGISITRRGLGIFAIYSYVVCTVPIGVRLLRSPLCRVYTRHNIRANDLSWIAKGPRTPNR